MAGRKSKYTPETVQKITQAIELGATYELACGFAGIAPATFYDWMNKKPEFSEAIKTAEGKGAVKWLAKIEAAATDGNWQAAAWKLERRYPTIYGRNVQDVNLNVDLTKLSDEQLRLLVEGKKP
jgi:hypothetical protein